MNSFAIQQKNNLEICKDGRYTLFALGRNAMYAACQALDIQPGDEVLTPAFDCDGSLQPFRVRGCSLVFYRSDPYSFAADLADIRGRISRRTRLIHIINHFGLPQDWDAILELRRTSDIPVLEDNAYSLFSSMNGRLFGTFGDVSIFSLRKNLPLIDGGILRINDERYIWKKPDTAARWIYPSEWNGLLTMMKRQAGYYKMPYPLRQLARGVFPQIHVPPPLYSENGGGYPAWPLRDIIGRDFSCDYTRPMSCLARFQLSHFTEDDFKGIVQKKQDCYRWLVQNLQALKGIRILWPDLPKGAVPFCLSVLVEEGRDNILKLLRKKYDVMAWPTLSRLVLDQLNDFPEVELLGRKLLQLNLPSDRVRSPHFLTYLKELVEDIYKWCKQTEA